MTFDDLNKIMEDAFGSMKLSDIARELNVTPQVVSNWKARNQVPYKYVKTLRTIIDEQVTSTVEKNDVNFPRFNYDFEDNQDSSISVKNIIGLTYNSFSNHYKIIIAVPVILSLLTFIYYTFIAEPIYKTSAKILPTTEKSQISGLASQFGFNIGSGADIGIGSSNLYPEIIRSRRLSKALLNREINLMIEDSIQKIKLIDYIVPFNDDWAEIENSYQKRIEAGIRLLKYEIISILFSRKTSLVDMTVSINNPQIAKEISSLILEEIDNVQSNIKLDKVKEKKKFIERKINDLDLELKSSEENLKDFRESNRSIQSSPALLLIEERMIRDISILTQIYIGLKNQYEQTLIEEVENKKMFIVLEYPEVPIRKSGPNAKKNTIIFYLFFTIFIIGFFTIRDWYINNFDSFIEEFFQSQD